MEAIGAYLLIINFAALIIMGVDKKRAHRNQWRISERSIFITALAGGGLGVLLGMYMFRHKTRHWKFTIGIPIILVLNIVVFGYLLQKLM